ncbi:leucine--tRNA ligase [Brevibacterium sp. NPDC049920]|uniref:leucine--tRNA ligase n=1 Tax=Brevibacterium sp. NPDC049920 TaxID=3155279 RepID=UPI0025FBF382|nr:leucine--tRNA ligase [uncultured Brevibacterium sp.]
MTSAAEQPDPVDFRYDAELAGRIETKWQQRWQENRTFAAPNPVGDLTEVPRGVRAADLEPVYLMDMFPYPSGKGLHVGHPLGYLAVDVYARFNRMLGKNVMHSLGYDAFGLPAEQYAVQTGQHPRVTTEENIANMRRQLRRLGLGHDDARTFATTDPEFVKWTQWIFLQIFDSWYDPEARDGQGGARPISELVAQFEAGRDTGTGSPWSELDAAAREAVLQQHRLAYISEAPVNWCPGLGTVLANEEVTAEGRSERGNFPVYTRRLKQWNMRITAYADRLADDLDTVEWPAAVKHMQRHWIGRSTGAVLAFDGPGGLPLEVYTTRPDTLFGATSLVLSPEHPLVDAVTAESYAADVPESWRGGAATPAEAVAAYQQRAARLTPVERQESREKSGVFTGTSVTNPATGESMPVFVADYVLMGYGTGAVMGVPAEDQRDWDFARAFGLPYIRTVQPAEGHDEDSAYTGEGAKINSRNAEIDLDGSSVDEAKDRMLAWLEGKGLARATTQYRLRDWLFSRQRYWGEPFPIVYDEAGTPIALPADQLPVDLPEVPDFSPRTFDADDLDSEPEPPLGRNADWVNVTLDLGDGPKVYRRETNTMPNWAGSSWYQLRYADPHNAEKLVDPANEAYWLGPDAPGESGGVDLYVGGVEHAVLHLLYARFWHKVLFDLGHVSSFEPFHRLINQGYIQAYAFTDERGAYVPAEEVEERVEGSESTFWYEGKQVSREYGKMGKSLKNMVTPDQMYAEYGADTFRVYEMSMGPLEQSRAWETRAVSGAQRFLQRVWRLVVDEATGASRVTEEPADDATRAVLHRTIAGVREDMEHLRFNTAIAKLIVLTNHLTKVGVAPREVIEPLTVMLAPLAPHLGEEIWELLGHTGTITYVPFPVHDERYLVPDTVTCVVQVKGKVRERLEVAPDIAADELEALALASKGAQRSLNGARVRKVIVRAPKLVNIVPDA